MHSETNAGSPAKRLAVVIVTFNRCHDLEVLLDRLYELREEFQHLAVINNASSDATPQVLDNATARFGDKMQVAHMDTNLGGAGGFHEGAKLALSLSVDWIWFSDDDAMPEPGALTSLLAAAESEGNLYGSVAVAKGSDDEALCWPALRVQPTDDGSAPRALTRSELRPVEEVAMLPFLGLMASKKRIQQVGLPNKRYFISGDDMEYCTRMKAAGAKLFQVRDSVVIHPSIPRYVVRLPGWDLYCLKMPPWRRYYDTRNRIWNSRLRSGHLGTLAAVGSVLVRALASLIYETERFGQVMATLRGMRDGIFRYAMSGNGSAILKGRRQRH